MHLLDKVFSKDPAVTKWIMEYKKSVDINYHLNLISIESTLIGKVFKGVECRHAGCSEVGQDGNPGVSLKQLFIDI